MKRTSLLLVFLLYAGAISAQRIVIGEKAPEIRIREWITEKPAGESLPRLIEFFHSKSPDSMANLGNLQRYAEGFEGRLVVIIVAREEADKVRSITAPVKRAYYVALDDGGKTFEAYGVQYVPFGVIVDARGRVLWLGNTTSLGEAEITKLLQ